MLLGGSGSVELVEERDRVRGEDDRDDHGQAREIPLDDVLATLGGGREAQAAEARVPPRVHEHEGDENRRDQHLEDREDLEHALRLAATPRNRPVLRCAPMQADERIRKLIVLGDNRLKQGLPGKAKETYAEALELAREAGLEKTVGPLIELRLADLTARDSAG